MCTWCDAALYNDVVEFQEHNAMWRQTNTLSPAPHTLSRLNLTTWYSGVALMRKTNCYLPSRELVCSWPRVLSDKTLVSEGSRDDLICCSTVFSPPLSLSHTHTHTHAGQGNSNYLGLNSEVPVKVSASRGSALPHNVNTPVSCHDASSSVLLTPNAHLSLPPSLPPFIPSSSPSYDLLWFRSNERLRCFYPPSLLLPILVWAPCT